MWIQFLLIVAVIVVALTVIRWCVVISIFFVVIGSVAFQIWRFGTFHSGIIIIIITSSTSAVVLVEVLIDLFPSFGIDLDQVYVLLGIKDGFR